MSAPRSIRLHPQDDVAIALTDLKPGEEGASEPIPRGHKYAMWSSSLGGSEP